MPVSLSTFIPCIACHAGETSAGDDTARQIEQGINSVAKTTGLSRQGKQTLLQWTIWNIYATALTIHDPHLHLEPGWNVVLPVDPTAGRSNLRLLLLRAGEPAHVAQNAVDMFYRNNPIPNAWDAIAAFYESPPGSTPLDAALRDMAWREWLDRLPGNDLPRQAGPYEALPAWAREMALFATNMVNKNCRGMKGLTNLDLRYLHAPGVDLQGCNLNGTNLFHANLCGANLKHTTIHGTILPAPELRRSESSPFDAPSPTRPSPLAMSSFPATPLFPAPPAFPTMPPSADSEQSSSDNDHE